jgi:hypothetical protein
MLNFCVLALLLQHHTVFFLLPQYKPSGSVFITNLHKLGSRGLEKVEHIFNLEAIQGR